MAHLIDPLPNHQTVAVLGYGASGKAAVRLLRHFGKDVIVSDQFLTNPPALQGVRFHVGRVSVDDATAVVLSPSFNPEWPENREKPELASVYARMSEGFLEALSEVELGLRAFHRPYIAVGGTDGKSTTAALTHALAKGFGYKAVLGGNSWRAFSDVVMESADADLAVVEISAFQLHRPHGIHPPVAITTNLAFDHLDHYAGWEDYAAAKAAMFANQGTSDTAILYAGDPHLQRLGEELRERGVNVVYFDNQECTSAVGAGEADGLVTVQRDGRMLQFRDTSIALPGAHNRRNVMAALLALLHVGHRRATMVELAEILANFQGLPHRICFVREHQGVRYFNDSKATNVHAACVGIASMDRPTVAIVGGVEKNLELDALWTALAPHGRAVIAMGELRERLVREAPTSLPVFAAGSMEEAVSLAAQQAHEGDAVLLAPASSSFDMFKSFEERGEVFERLVKSLEAPERSV